MAPIFFCACLLAVGLGAISEVIDNAHEAGARHPATDRVALLFVGIIGAVCVAAAIVELS